MRARTASQFEGCYSYRSGPEPSAVVRSAEAAEPPLSAEAAQAEPPLSQAQLIIRPGENG